MDTIIITRTCPFCGKTYSKEFDKKTYEDGLKKYRQGSLIQDAFPTLSPDDREFLKTGICDACWQSM